MAEQPTPLAAPVNVQIGLGAQYIKDFSFESPHAPQIFSELVSPPQITIDVNVLSRKNGDMSFEACLKLTLSAKMGEKTVYIAELSYAGLFMLPKELPEEQVKLFLLIEAPRLLFPFARSIIANAVRDGGFPHIVIQPIDFMALYASQRGSIGTMVTEGVA